MAGSHITRFHTHEVEQPVIADLWSQKDQDFDNQHDRQLMASKRDTDRGHHNPSDPQPTTSVDCKLITRKDESISSETMKNEDTTDIMYELAVMRPPNRLRSSIPESTFYQISKMVMKEAVEDKKMKLMQSGTKIPTKDVDVLCLINTCKLYWLINDGINKYNNGNSVQGFINNMVGNTTVPTVVERGNKATTACKLGKANPVAVHENNHDNMYLANTGLKSNNILGAKIVEEKEIWFYGWAGTYDECNNYYHTATEENEPGSSHAFTGDDSIFKLTKTKHNGKLKTRLVSEVPTSVKSDFYIGKRQK